MKTKYYILVSLVGLVIVLTLIFSYFLKLEKIQILEMLKEESSKEEAPKEEIPKKEVPKEEVTQKKEVEALMDEINLIVNAFSNLGDSINELDEDEDLLKIFLGD